MRKRSVLKEWWPVILGIALGLLLFSLMSEMDLEDEQNEEAHYCEMVKLQKETGKGWPDYKGIYDQVCAR